MAVTGTRGRPEASQSLKRCHFESNMRSNEKVDLDHKSITELLCIGKFIRFDVTSNRDEGGGWGER